MIEYKSKSMKTIERLEMQICETESKYLNQIQHSPAVDKTLQDIDIKMKTRNLDDLRSIINDLTLIIRSKDFQIYNLTEQ